MMINKSWWERLSDLVIFSVFSSDIPIHFQELIRSVPLKCLIYFKAGINTNYFWNIHEEKYFDPFRILRLFIKSFGDPFVGITLTFSDSSFNSFSAKTFFALFEVKFFFNFFNLICLFLWNWQYHFYLRNLLVLILH